MTMRFLVGESFENPVLSTYYKSPPKEQTTPGQIRSNKLKSAEEEDYQINNFNSVLGQFLEQARNIFL